MRLGTYTTFDVPTQKQDEAKEWLTKQFDTIDGNVRVVNNPHDFGVYPSFEIDFPFSLENYDEDLDGEELGERYDSFIEKANEIEKEYGKAFEAYL